MFGGTFGVELLGFPVARDTVQYQNFKRQSLTGQALPDCRDNASMEPVQKRALTVQGFLVDNGSWCSSFPSRLRAEQLADKARSDPKPDCICTMLLLAITSFCLKPFCLLFSLTNKGPLGHLEWGASTCI